MPGPYVDPRFQSPGTQNIPGALPPQPWQAQPLAAQPQAPGPQMAQTVQPGAAPGGMPAPSNAGALAAMLALNQQTPDQMQLKRQQARADALRAGAPDMMKGQGGMPNYLGTLAAVVASRRADKMDSENQELATKVGREQRNAGQSALASLTGANPSDFSQGNAASDAVADAIAKQKAKQGGMSWLSRMFGGGEEA